MAFWIISLAMTCGVGLWLVLPLLRPPVVAASAPELSIYRNQLAEVDHDVARGLIAPADASRLRTEVSRRVLEADRMRPSAVTARASATATLLALCAVALVLASSLWIYSRIGAPAYPDLPRSARLAQSEALRAARPSQAEAEAKQAALPSADLPDDPAYLAQIAALRSAVASHPDDLTGQQLLAQNEAAIGNFAAAIQAQSQVLRLHGADQTASDHALMSLLQIMAAGGEVTAEAEQSLTEALRRDPRNPTARYYSGLLFAQTGRPDLAFRLWRPLLAESQPTDPWVAPLRIVMPSIAAAAGADYDLPPEAKGPDADELAAAATMTPEQRADMIGSMVATLSDRLATQGGTAAEWAQLITAYGVLGDKDQAAKIWSEAQQTFAAAPADLALILAAATKAGVAP